MSNRTQGVVKPNVTNCRMWEDLGGVYLKPEFRAKSWYVFEADYGGQVIATVPVELIPRWVPRRRLGRALRTLNGMWSKEGASVYVVTDVGCYPSFAEWKDDPEQYSIYIDSTMPWTERRVLKDVPLGLCAANVAQEPFDEQTKLAGWKFVGWVEGGMGGGRLLAGEAWFHDGVLFRGQDGVNEIRRLLGLQKLESFDLVMAPERRAHNQLVHAILGRT